MLRNYYDIFRVRRNATEEEITHAYEVLRERYRQRYEGNEFDRKAAVLDKAYGVLSDPRMRAKYDQMLLEMENSENAPASVPAPAAREARKAPAPAKREAEPEVRSARRVYQPEAEEEPALRQKAVRRGAARRDEEEDYVPRKRAARQAAPADEDGQAPRPKQKLTGLIIAVVVAFLLIAGGGFYFYTYMYLPESHYKDAVKMASSGQYDEAITAFEALKDYKDSASQIVDIKKKIGNDYVQQKKYDEALEVFNSIGDEDAVATAKKAMAKSLVTQKEYAKATAIYEALNDEDGKKSVQYAMAADDLKANKQAEAYAILKELGDYKDAADKVKELQDAAQTQITKVLDGFTENNFPLLSPDNAKQAVLNLTQVESLAKDYELSSITEDVSGKWDLVESLYFNIYFRGLGDAYITKNDTYFDTVGLTATDSVSKAEDYAAKFFGDKPEYLSLYLNCLAGASEKTLQVTWYKYKLDRATAEYKEREEVFKNDPVVLPKIKKSAEKLVGFAKDTFTYGEGLYAAEVTVEGDTDPAALVYFYVK